MRVVKRRALVLTATAAVLAVALGTTLGPGGDLSLLPRDDTERRIVREIRAPRVALGFLAGAGLATAGMAFQALFRNALATPYTVGVSAGASLGAAIYVYSGAAATVLGIAGGTLAAIGGALLAIGFVFGLARSARDLSGTTLLLAGVAVSFTCTSIILVIQYAGDVTTSFRVGRWLLGGLEAIGFTTPLQLLPFVAAGVAILAGLSRDLNLLAVGDDWASTRGVAVRRVKQTVFAVSCVMVAAIVATCGPIGFVGLIVPHIGRLSLGPEHRALVPFCIAGGGAFLVLCDAVGRTLFAPIELPVGIITALIGGPFFLALLARGHAAHRLKW
jgi:iron complex transport system permease protein